MRITGNSLNGEISDVIEAAKADLRLSGVVNIDEADPLIIRAVCLYAKAHFKSGENTDRYMRDYTLLKCSLAMAGGYNGVE